MKSSQSITLLLMCICSFISEEVFAQNNHALYNPPSLLILPGTTDNYAIKSRQFTGIPSIAISKKGWMWAVWYASETPAEDSNNYIVVSTSNDGGNTWKENMIIDPDGNGPMRAFDPEVWIDPDGRLWIFWAQTIGHDGTIAGVWSITTTNPNIEQPDWSKPTRLTNGVMMCKPVVLSNGDWVLPASTWKLTDKSAKVIVSTDKGRSWYERGAVNIPEIDRNFDEHMIVEKNDGVLWMLVRTTYGIGESISTDRGKTWSPLIPSNIKHPSARFFIRRLISGNLLLVKHGPIEMKTGRSHLMAFLSNNDGATWSKGLLLDERKGVSYPDGQQGKDEEIYIIYDHQRILNQEILIASFTEEDILANDYDQRIANVYKRRILVSKGIKK